MSQTSSIGQSVTSHLVFHWFICVSLSNTNIHTFWMSYWAFFSPVETAQRLQLFLWVFQIDLKKNGHFLIFFPVFQMQKECFSLPVIKATIRLFLYFTGAKNIYLYMPLYQYIHANVAGRQKRLMLPAKWKNSTLCRPTCGSFWGKKEIKRDTTDPLGTCRVELCREDLRWDRLPACMRQSFTGHLQWNCGYPIFILQPPNLPPLPTFLTVPKLSAFAIWSVFIYNLHKVKRSVLLDIIE